MRCRFNRAVTLLPYQLFQPYRWAATLSYNVPSVVCTVADTLFACLPAVNGSPLHTTQQLLPRRFAFDVVLLMRLLVGSFHGSEWKERKGIEMERIL